MKKVILPFLFIFTLLFISCSQEDIYSCDPEINDWVYSNLNDIKVMTRSEWQSLDIEKRIPSYRAFTLEQKISFWNEKLDNILSNNWSNEEITHINDLKVFLNNHAQLLNGISTLSEEEAFAVQSYMDKWIKIGIEELDWNEDLIIAMVGKGENLGDALDLLTNPASTRSLKPKLSCNCHLAEWVEWCGFYSSCVEVECDDTTLGCGFFLAFECTGRCSGT